MNLQQEAIVDAGLTTSDESKETNTEKAGEVNSLNYSDTISTSDYKKVNTNCSSLIVMIMLHFFCNTVRQKRLMSHLTSILTQP
jgi:hypothetical protein